MTQKADFNAEEWSTVLDGPLYAGMYIISSERVPSAFGTPMAQP